MTAPFHLLLGIDSRDSRLDLVTLDLVTLDPATEKAIPHTVSTDPTALRKWFATQRAALPKGARIAVAFHQPATNLIVFFSQFAGVTLYPLNPAAVRSYGKSFALSGAHTDSTDAALIARYLAHNHAQLRPLPARSGDLEELDRLNQSQRLERMRLRYRRGRVARGHRDGRVAAQFR